MREGITVEVSAADRARLEAIVADRNSPQKHVWRARIILATADGLRHGRDHAPEPASPSRASGAGRSASCRGRGRAAARQDPEARQAAAAGATVVERVVELTCARAAGRGDALDRPGDGQGGRASRCARCSGSGRRTGLQPHRVRTFKLSSDPAFVAKLRDIVGLYMRAAGARGRAVGRREVACVDGPRPARVMLSFWCSGLLAVMCPASIAVGKDRRPRWVPRIGASTNPRARDPRLLQASPDPSVQPTTPSLSFPRKRPLGGSA